MIDRRFYADATALIGLARIDRLDLLAALESPVLVTSHVWHEATANPENPGVTVLQRARRRNLFTVVEEGDPNAFPYLGAGESSVISAAIAHQAAVLIDERQARNWLERNPEIRVRIPQITGLFGLLLVAKRGDHIFLVRPVLDALLLEGLRISRRLYEQTLRDADEL